MEPVRRANWRWRAVGIILLIALDTYIVARYGFDGIIATPIVSITVLLALFRRYTALTVWVVGVFLAGFIIPAINAGAPAARKVFCANNLRDIAAAIAQYESAHGALPCPFTTASDGARLHSWRVLILPYLGHQALYDQIDLTKPWDDPANLKIGDQMPQVYRCPEAQHQSKWRTLGNQTSYLAVVGPDTPWPPEGVRHTSDMSPTDDRKLLVIELPPHQQHWMAPNDPTLEQFLTDDALASENQSHAHTYSDQCVDNDGSVLAITLDRIEASKWRELWTTDAANSH